MPRATSSTTDAGFTRLVDFLTTELDFAAEYYDNRYLKRRISARLQRTSADSYTAYRRYLTDNPDEQHALLDTLNVNVTEFFRNAEVWEEIADILADLTDTHRRVRVWSAPCADGREPYSLAMLACDDDRIDERAVDILGTDIDESALSHARRGVYESTDTTAISDELDRFDPATDYVTQEGSTYRLTDDIKDLVRFKKHDLIQGDARGPFELVLCRNLFIYISTEYKQQVLDTITASLQEDSVFVSGKTEPLPPTYKGAFTPINDSLRIYRYQDPPEDGR